MRLEGGVDGGMSQPVVVLSGGGDDGCHRSRSAFIVMW